MQLSEEMLALARQVQTQDNSWHITSNPVYQVKHKIRVYGIETGYHDGDFGTWINTHHSEPVNDSQHRRLEAMYRKDGTDYTPNFRRARYTEVEEVIQCFFSEAAARAFMVRQSHNFGGMFLYVETGYTNPEWQTIRNFLLSIPLNS